MLFIGAYVQYRISIY